MSPVTPTPSPEMGEVGLVCRSYCVAGVPDTLGEYQLITNLSSHTEFLREIIKIIHFASQRIVLNENDSIRGVGITPNGAKWGCAVNYGGCT